MNVRSSRSHFLITLYVDAGHDEGLQARTFGRLSIIDLAGSERLRKTKSTKVHETGFINKSLYTLGKVINGIVKSGGTQTKRNTSNIPFRESVLTKLVISSLGGGTMCSMIACVSAGNDAYEETARTLSFAMRVKGIFNHPSVHVDEQEMLVSGLKREIENLKRENMQLKHMVIEVSQEASLASSKGGSGGVKHIGLRSEVEQFIEGAGLGFDDDAADDAGEFGLTNEEEEEEEEEEEDVEEEKDVYYDEKADYGYNESPSEDEEEEEEEEGEEDDEEEKDYDELEDYDDDEFENDDYEEDQGGNEQERTRNQSQNTQAGGSDAVQRIAELQLLLEDAKAEADAKGGSRVSKEILELEGELDDLQSELQLTAQLDFLGVNLEDSGGEDEAKEKELDDMIANATALSEDLGDEDDGRRELGLMPPNEEYGGDENWQEVWENSLAILAGEDNNEAEKLRQIEKLERLPDGAAVNPNRRFKKKKKKKRN